MLGLGLGLGLGFGLGLARDLPYYEGGNPLSPHVTVRVRVNITRKKLTLQYWLQNIHKGFGQGYFRVVCAIRLT